MKSRLIWAKGEPVPKQFRALLAAKQRLAMSVSGEQGCHYAPLSRISPLQESGHLLPMAVPPLGYTTEAMLHSHIITGGGNLPLFMLLIIF